jgi:hypothetical protein
METENSKDTKRLPTASNRPTATILLFPRVDIPQLRDTLHTEINRIMDLGMGNMYISSLDDFRDAVSRSIIVGLTSIEYQIDSDTAQAMIYLRDLISKEIGLSPDSFIFPVERDFAESSVSIADTLLLEYVFQPLSEDDMFRDESLEMITDEYTKLAELYSASTYDDREYSYTLRELSSIIPTVLDEITRLIDILRG